MNEKPFELGDKEIAIIAARMRHQWREAIRIVRMLNGRDDEDAAVTRARTTSRLPQRLRRRRRRAQ